MTNLFRKLFSKPSTKLSPKADEVETSLPDSGALSGNGIVVTTRELIALQQRAKKLDLSHPTMASASTTGSHRSRFRGRGMDYQESRIYQPGDDIRNMDWRVTARTGKPHTKLYQEERERPVILLVDFSATMFFGSTQSLKSVVAAKAATLIAWAVASKGDRIGALLITSQGENNKNQHHELSPKMGKRGVLQLIRALVTFSDPSKGLASRADSGLAKTNLNNALNNTLNNELKRLRLLAHHGSIVFLISDFYNINKETGQHFRAIAEHNEIQAIQIIDPLEVTPPPPNNYTITDGKQTGVLDTRSKKCSQHYSESFNDHQQQLNNLMMMHKIPLMQLSTSDDLLLKLQQNFGHKKRASSAANKSAPNQKQTNSKVA